MMAKRGEEKTKIILQVAEGDFDIDKVTEAAVKDYKKNNKEALKNINVYIKPEDKKAYYTANGDKITGNINL